MAPIPTNAFGAGPHTISKRASDATAALGSLLRRSLEPRRPSEGNYTRPGKMNGGVLVVFCLIGASLGLLVWWLFIRRSGFIWRKYDWADYKASVLRRPQDRPDDAITVFSDGTARRGGSGSSVGRSVVLGELDTTYQKSYVAGEKPWNAHLPPPPKQPSLISAAYRDVKDSVWGKIRGGDRSENDTVVQRERSLRRERSRRRRREKRDRERGKQHQEEQSPIEMRKQNYRPYDAQQYRNEETETEISTAFVDTQRPAPPLTGMSHSNIQPPPLHRPRGSRSQPTRTQTRGQRVQRPERASTRAGKAPAREPSYRPGDDHANTRYHRAHNRNNSQAVPSESESDTDTDSDTESSDDDDSTIDQSQLGMAKGNKVYKHTISPEQTFWGNARPVERNGGGAGGTYGGGAPALMPSSSKAPRGYRAASVGSLSSDGSVRSSNAGR
ncbi:hypothetical protein BZA77DRAFT_300134 [Pyronema omphalodes]|nr:hypothetical protein BZA77DRAFT_300134 [Pyronema omphalodes]